MVFVCMCAWLFFCILSRRKKHQDLCGICVLFLCACNVLFFFVFLLSGNKQIRLDNFCCPVSCIIVQNLLTRTKDLVLSWRSWRTCADLENKFRVSFGDPWIFPLNNTKMLRLKILFNDITAQFFESVDFVAGAKRFLGCKTKGS